jgi:hypothetical protein
LSEIWRCTKKYCVITDRATETSAADNADVIACLQMGFIGTWGENYYSDYFGDPSSKWQRENWLIKNWSDKNEVLKALLNALPQSQDDTGAHTANETTLCIWC